MAGLPQAACKLLYAYFTFTFIPRFLISVSLLFTITDHSWVILLDVSVMVSVHDAEVIFD